MISRWVGVLFCLLATVACGAAPELAPASPVNYPAVAEAPPDVTATTSGDLTAGKAYAEPVPRARSLATEADKGEMLAQAPAVPPSPKAEPKKPVGQAGGGKEKPPNVSDAAVALQPMLIYTATLTMAVFEVARAIGEVEELGRSVGGYLARRDDKTITIRVPAARFEESIRRLEKLGDVVHRNVTAEDVTEEFLDLEVRLKNARAVRERLEQLLAKANKVEESLLIQRELDRVAGEIERIEGRMKFLRDRVAFSTITVTFQPRRSEVIGAERFNLPVPWLYELGLRRLLTL